MRSAGFDLPVCRYRITQRVAVGLLVWFFAMGAMQSICSVMQYGRSDLTAAINMCCMRHPGSRLSGFIKPGNSIALLWTTVYTSLGMMTQNGANLILTDCTFLNRSAKSQGRHRLVDQFPYLNFILPSSFITFLIRLPTIVTGNNTTRASNWPYWRRSIANCSYPQWTWNPTRFTTNFSAQVGNFHLQYFRSWPSLLIDTAKLDVEFVSRTLISGLINSYNFKTTMTSSHEGESFKQ